MGRLIFMLISMLGRTMLSIIIRIAASEAVDHLLGRVAPDLKYRLNKARTGRNFSKPRATDPIPASEYRAEEIRTAQAKQQKNEMSEQSEPFFDSENNSELVKLGRTLLLILGVGIVLVLAAVIFAIQQ